MELRKNLVLDTGIMVDYLSENNSIFNDWLDNNIFIEDSNYILHAHNNNKAELLYILCRKFGFKKAKKLITESIESKIIFHTGETIANIAAQIKCLSPIALVDCFSIATAINFNARIIFKSGKELTSKVCKKIEHNFEITIEFPNEFLI